MMIEAAGSSLVRDREQHGQSRERADPREDADHRPHEAPDKAVKQVGGGENDRKAKLQVLEDLHPSDTQKPLRQADLQEITEEPVYHKGTAEGGGDDHRPSLGLDDPEHESGHEDRSEEETQDGKEKGHDAKADEDGEDSACSRPSGQNFSRGLEGGLPRPEASSRRPERPIRIPARKGMKPATGPEAASQIFSLRDSRQIPTARRIQTT
jgi:hypothetical protein